MRATTYPTGTPGNINASIRVLCRSVSGTWWVLRPDFSPKLKPMHAPRRATIPMPIRSNVLSFDGILVPNNQRRWEERNRRSRLTLTTRSHFGVDSNSYNLFNNSWASVAWPLPLDNLTHHTPTPSTPSRRWTAHRNLEGTSGLADWSNHCRYSTFRTCSTSIRWFPQAPSALVQRTPSWSVAPTRAFPRRNRQRPYSAYSTKCCSAWRQEKVRPSPKCRNTSPLSLSGLICSIGPTNSTRTAFLPLAAVGPFPRIAFQMRPIQWSCSGPHSN